MEANTNISKEEEKALQNFFCENGMYFRITRKNFEETDYDRDNIMKYAEIVRQKIKEDKATKADYLKATEILFILSCYSDVKWIRYLRNDFYLKVFR